MTSNVVWCKQKGEIREIAKSRNVKYLVRIPGSTSGTKSRNREKSSALPRFRIQDPEPNRENVKSQVPCPDPGSRVRKPNRENAKTRNREIAKSQNRIGPESTQGQYCLRTAEWCTSTAETLLLKYHLSGSRVLLKYCLSTA